MAASLRKRNNDFRNRVNSDSKSENKKSHPLKNSLDGLILFASLIAVYVTVWLFVNARVSYFPKPVQSNDAQPSNFAEQRAHKHLSDITRLGPRVAGSDSCKAAADYLVRELDTIKSLAKKVHNVEVDVQSVSGSFVMDFESHGLGSYPSVYENQLNVIVRIGPEKLTHSLLVNCHFDTVVDSPGASDDAVSCVVMLEVLRALSQQEESFPHNIIFLFNGAEENILQTSHGFITQHKWAPSIRAFVNLESAGAGGWELLFQTGPDHPWLIETYIAAAPYPHSSVIGQEIFQGGLVPSDTDFRIFRDYGKVPGLDIAHIRNGYVYHTRNDLPRFVESGCLQRTGDNVLALVKALVTSPYLVDPGDYRHGSLVFFDFLGFFVVAYPQRLAVLLNWAVVACVLAFAVRKALRSSHKTSTWLIYQLAALAVLAFTWILLVGVAVAMAKLMTAIGRDMSYFTHDFNVVFIFICPAVTSTLCFHLWLKNFLLQNWRGIDVADLYFEANLLLWSAVVGVLTSFGIMSAFIPLMFVCGPLLARFLAHIWSLPLDDNKTYSAVTVMGILIPQTYVTYLGYQVLIFFIPIMGRIGTEEQPDVAVAVMTMLPIAIVTTLQIGLVYLSQKMGQVVKCLLLTTLLGVLAVALTPLGFPFSSTQAASKQRITLIHIDRQFHSFTGEVKKRNSSMWLMPSDHLGASLLEKEVPHLFHDFVNVECEGIYCGRPFLIPILSRLDPRKTLDLPAPDLQVPRVEVKMIRTTQLSEQVYRKEFEITGPDHVTIVISPFAGSHIVSWSFGHYEPVVVSTLRSQESRDRDTHFVYYAYGERPSKPWSFHIDFYVPSSLDPARAIVDMSFTGHYLHGNYQYTATMDEFAHQLPAWTTVSGWSATLDIHQF